MGSVFLFLAVSLIVTLVAFWFHKRAERNKLPPEKRPSSYHPFRTQSSDKSSLLANAAPSPEDDKSSMFSRDRSTSVSLYVDTDVVDKRASMENVSLIPLHITPAEETHDPMDRTTSVGSRVSALSRGSSRYSTGASSLALSPIQQNEDGDLGTSSRPRSTSTTSMRYYSTTPTDRESAPQIPKIVHTPSE